MPDRVLATDGQEVIGPDDIFAGQNVWQSMGGMEVGSVWGHGSYVAPDWTADWLHREAMFILDRWSSSPEGFTALSTERQAELQSRLQQLVLAAFFFWTSWAASTNRPNDTTTYTSNWPHEPLVGNRPTADAIVWTGVSIIVRPRTIPCSYPWQRRRSAPSSSTSRS